MTCLSQIKMKERPGSPSRWHSKALKGTQMHSDALNGTQWHSEALNSNHLALADQDEGEAWVALPKEEITLAEVDRLEGVEHLWGSEGAVVSTCMQEITLAEVDRLEGVERRVEHRLTLG